MLEGTRPAAAGRARWLSAAASPYAALALVLAAVLAAYLRSLGEWFVSDDFWYLRAVQRISWWDWTRNAFDFNEEGPVVEFAYRPLYVIEYPLLYGALGLNAWAYHLLSVAFHMANTLLVWLIARRVGGRDATAHVAALVFGLHPTYAPTVAWMSANASVFGLFLALSSILALLRYLDGGPRRMVYWAASLVAMTAAILMHTETVSTVPILFVVFALVPQRDLKDLLSVQTWLPVIPHGIVGLGLVSLHAWIRAHSELQQMLFKWGSHVFEGTLDNLALAANPFSLDVDDVALWRTVIAVVPLVAISAWLLWRERRRPGSGAAAVVWFYLTLIPLAAFVLGPQPRKLYVVGPPLAIMLAIAAVAAWDRLRARDARYGAAIGYAAFAVLALTFSVRTWQVLDGDNLSDVNRYGVSSASYRLMVDQIRETYPDIPEGRRIELVGVPQSMLPEGRLDNRFINAVQLYYGQVSVVGVSTLDDLPPAPPGGPDRYRVYYECPPIC
jgi:4-amino-4-deoxy-L-arabinose transferase-like glycosyltransferase